MKKYFVLFTLAMMVCSANQVFAHCQVPCGIYDDHARIHMMQEHAQTIAKARQEIVALQKEKNLSKRNDNQIVRWVMTKEKHATDIQTIVNEYFFIQRIKLDWPDKKRNTLLNMLHKISVLAMQCKQSLDEAVYSQLNVAINAFEQEYLQDQKKS